MKCRHCEEEITLRRTTADEVLVDPDSGLPEGRIVWVDDTGLWADSCATDNDGIALDGTKAPLHEPSVVYRTITKATVAPDGDYSYGPYVKIRVFPEDHHWAIDAMDANDHYSEAVWSHWNNVPMTKDVAVEHALDFGREHAPGVMVVEILEEAPLLSKQEILAKFGIRI